VSNAGKIGSLQRSGSAFLFFPIGECFSSALLPHISPGYGATFSSGETGFHPSAHKSGLSKLTAYLPGAATCQTIRGTLTRLLAPCLQLAAGTIIYKPNIWNTDN
jgi:hypothetical protein